MSTQSQRPIHAHQNRLRLCPADRAVDQVVAALGVGEAPEPVGAAIHPPAGCGGVHLGQKSGDGHREQDDGFGTRGVKLQGLFAGQIAAEGRVEDGLNGRRLSKANYDPRLSNRLKLFLVGEHEGKRTLPRNRMRGWRRVTPHPPPLQSTP